MVKKSNVHRVALFLAIFVSAIVSIVPFPNQMPQEGLSSSWMLGLNEATARKLVFGEDLVFTFGPYSSIYTRLYHPGIDLLATSVATYLAISFTTCAVLFLRNSRWQDEIFFLFALNASFYCPDSLLLAYPLLAGLYWIKIENRPDGIASRRPNVLLTLIIFAPFGLLPLIKGTGLIVSAGISAILALMQVRKGNWQQLLTMVVTIFAAAMVFWALVGQPVEGLAPYISGLNEISRGYSEAMSISDLAQGFRTSC